MGNGCENGAGRARGSEFEIFIAFGLRPVGMPSGIRDGCLRIMNALAAEPPLMVSRTCPVLIEALGSVKPERHRPDVYAESADDYVHVLDALRYALVNAPSPAARPWTPPEPEGDPFAGGFNAYITRHCGSSRIW